MRRWTNLYSTNIYCRHLRKTAEGIITSSIIDVIAEGFRTGLPHPGDPLADQKPQTIVMPGMNLRGIPPEVLDRFAKDAGLPSSDLPKLLAEAVVNLIQTTGNSEIVPKPAKAETIIPERTWESIPFKMKES